MTMWMFLKEDLGKHIYILLARCRDHVINFRQFIASYVVPMLYDFVSLYIGPTVYAPTFLERSG